MTRTFHSGPAALGLLLGLLACAPLVAQATAQETPAAEPAEAEKLQEAQDLFEQEKYNEAVKAYRAADKLAGGSCLECQLGLARSFNKLGAHREALKNADAVLRMAEDRNHIARAYNEQGVAFLSSAGEDQKQLEQAERAFRKVLELSGGTSNAARFNLGFVLLRLARDAEGTALLKEYLEKDPQAVSAEAARDLIANPLRARKRLVPDFELVTLAGDYLTAEDLQGKVVLLDFWATWCGPCVAALPGLRMLSRRMEKDPFVMVSVSVDSDEKVLRDFIAANRMTWPQVRDERHEFVRKCQVEGFPSYLLVSHEGEILYVTRGWSEAIDRELRSKVAGAISAAKSAAKRSAKADETR